MATPRAADAPVRTHAAPRPRAGLAVISPILAPGLALGLALAAPAVAGAAPDVDRFAEAGAPYAAEVHARFHDRWQTFTDLLASLPAGSRLRDDESLSVTIELRLSMGGQVLAMERQSGGEADGFIEAPFDLVRDVGALPPPPEALRSDDGFVYLRWRFHRGPGDRDEGAVFQRRLAVGLAIDNLVKIGAGSQAAARAAQEIAARPAKAAEVLWLLADAVARHDVEAADPLRRANAARALGMLDGSNEALSRLARDADPAVRAAAFESIAMGDPPVTLLGLVVEALDGESAAAAARAIERLGRQGNRTSIPTATLRAALDRTLRAARAPLETAEALRALGDEAGACAAVAALLAAPETRTVGAQAAMQLGAPALEAPLIARLGEARSPAERALLLEALAAIGPRLGADGRGALFRGLHDSDGTVRAAAARALASAGEHKARGRLVDGLADPDARARAAIVAALVVLGGDEAADELFRPMKDPAPEVRAALASALVAHPSPKAVPILRRLRADAVPAVQAAAREPDPPSTSSEPACAGDLDKRLLGAATDLDRSRAAAEWLAARGEVRGHALLDTAANDVRICALAP